MRAVTGKPIKLIGTGEKMDALEDFHPARIADRILGMGDIVSLVEKAAQSIDAEKAAAMARRMQKGEFDLNDLSDQLKQMQNLGGMGGIMGLLPGVGKMKKQMEAAGLDDKLLKRQLAIISSMTRQERRSPKILNANRKKRVAAGSGTSVQEINKLLKMQLQMADMMKKMGKGGMKGMMGSLGGMMGGGIPGGGIGSGMLGRMMGGGMPGMPGGMPDLSKLDPKEIERLAREMGAGNAAPGGMPKLPGGMGSLPGSGISGLPGFGKKK
jgi:signal recognition particle subunit SRP54